MAAIIKEEFRVKLLEMFIQRIASSDSLYLGIGRPQYWSIETSSDSTIPVPTNTPFSEDWSDLMSLKIVNASDLSHSLPKEVWKANVVYDAYRHDWDGTRVAEYNGASSIDTQPTSLSGVKCFVVTANFDIYVCLKQKVISGVAQPSIYSPETGVPVGTNTTVLKTADGYYWKFLATTSSSDIIKFASEGYIPIKTLSVDPGSGSQYYSQWQAQSYSANFKGGIYVINVISGGSGYNGGVAGSREVTDAETDAEFKVIGDGIGLQYTVFYGTNGSITDIEITNPGSGYSYATIVAANGSGASFDIVYTPKRGLGVDPILDTSARYLIVSLSLEGDEGGKFTISNDYRKLALILNPTMYRSSTVATSTTLNATTTMIVGSTGDGPAGGLGAAYLPDAIITGETSGSKGRVVDYDDTTGILRFIRTSSENGGLSSANKSFVAGESISTTLGLGGGVILNSGGLIAPDVQHNSGEIIYSEYRAPILRSANQSESIIIVLRF